MGRWVDGWMGRGMDGWMGRGVDECENGKETIGRPKQESGVFKLERIS
jgi:hypothetical protein